jgi:hypothetical protein
VRLDLAFDFDAARPNNHDVVIVLDVTFGEYRISNAERSF